MAALLPAQRTLEGRSGAAAGTIEEQPHQDGDIGNVLQTGSRRETGASRESTGGGMLDIMGFNGGPYNEVDPLGGGNSGVPAGVGSVEDQHFPSDDPVESLFGVKGVRWEIPPFGGITTSWRRFET